MQNTSKIRANAYSFGTILDGRTYGILGRVGFGGHEKDDEIKGGGNSYDFDSRLYDTRLGRWLAIDAFSAKYPSFSPYSYVANNPLIFMDMDGNDIVVFNQAGREIVRIQSNKKFETYVFDKTGKLAQAPMPKVIKGYELARYQKYDYNIAAQTFLFNEKLAGDKSELPTASDEHTLKDNPNMPDPLDPTLVKATIIRESKAGVGGAGPNGTGENDIMQVNNSGDKAGKEAIGLTGKEKLKPNESVQKGIQWLYTKGLSYGTDGKGEWNSADGSWDEAVKKYNGSKNKVAYQKDVLEKTKTATPPKADDYTNDVPAPAPVKPKPAEKVKFKRVEKIKQ